VGIAQLNSWIAAALAALLALGSLILFIWSWHYQRSMLRKSREDGAKRLQLKTIPDELTDLLLTTANGILERRAAVARDVDTKLSALLGFVAGSAGIVAIVYGRAGGGNLPVTPLLASGVFSLLLTIIACLEGTYNRPRPGIEIHLLKALETTDGQIQAKETLSATFVERLFRLSESYNQANGVKRRLLFTASYSFVSAIVAIALNALWFQAVEEHILFHCGGHLRGYF
jgi:hypothetical protein